MRYLLLTGFFCRSLSVFIPLILSKVSIFFDLPDKITVPTLVLLKGLFMKNKRNTFLKLTPREKNIAYFTIFLVVLCGAVKFGIAPFITRFRLLQKELIMARLDLDEYRLVLANAKQLKDFYAGLLPVEKEGGDNSDVLAFTLKRLESLSREAGLRINDVRPLDVLEKGAAKELSIELKVEGTIAAIAKFLYNIEYSSQFITVKKMDINYKTQNILEAGIVVSRPVGR